jgi:hypothetical protein
MPRGVHLAERRSAASATRNPALEKARLPEIGAQDAKALALTASDVLHKKT